MPEIIITIELDYSLFLFFQYLGSTLLPRYYPYLTILLISILIGLFRYSRLSARYKMLLLLISLVFISEIVSRCLAIAFENSRPTYHILIPLQCILYGIIYGLAQPNKKMCYAFFGLATCASVLNSFFFQSIYQFPTYSLLALCLVLITTVLFDFKRLILFPTEIQLSAQPDFWFNLGTLVFFTCTFFIFGFINLALKFTPPWATWLIWGTNLFLYACYGIALVLEARKNSLL